MSEIIAIFHYFLLERLKITSLASGNVFFGLEDRHEGQSKN